jgi:hypothetical protein
MGQCFYLSLDLKKEQCNDGHHSSVFRPTHVYFPFCLTFSIPLSFNLYVFHVVFAYRNSTPHMKKTQTLNACTYFNLSLLSYNLCMFWTMFVFTITQCHYNTLCEKNARNQCASVFHFVSLPLFQSPFLFEFLYICFPCCVFIGT